mgnify:CR=1 FL=1
MSAALISGFFIGISLILAIGAQNAFILRQGIIGKHVFYVALFCALSDALLISVGVYGISFFFDNIGNQILNWLFGFSSLWLALYGVTKLKTVFKSDNAIKIEVSKSLDLFPTITTVAVLTFANPHVYLDTMVLIGSISQQFSGINKDLFAVGAILSSFVFFFSLAYGAKLLLPIMQRPSAWRILDGLVAMIMFTIAIKLAYSGNWL